MVIIVMIVTTITTLAAKARMGRTVSIARAKARLSHWIREAEGGEPVVITRRGTPVAALVPAEDLERLRRLRAAGPEGGLVSLAGGWEGSEELVRALGPTSRTAPREIETLD